MSQGLAKRCPPITVSFLHTLFVLAHNYVDMLCNYMISLQFIPMVCWKRSRSATVTDPGDDQVLDEAVRKLISSFSGDISVSPERSISIVTPEGSGTHTYGSASHRSVDLISHT